LRVGGLFRLQAHRYADQSSSPHDGVGKKLKSPFSRIAHDTVGIDLVAMCVNDIVVKRGRTAVLLDYFRNGKACRPKAEAVAQGNRRGLSPGWLRLIGGKPPRCRLYTEGEYDLAGFAVGVVDRPKIIDGRSIVPAMP